MMRAGFLGLLALALAGCGDSGDDASGSGGSGSGGTSSGGTSSGGTSSGGSSGSGGAATGGSGGTSTGGGGSGGSTPQGAITISGSGFGTKANAGPILFDDFESGTAGAKTENQPAKIGDWQSGAGSEGPVYSDAMVRVGSRSAVNPFTPDLYNSSLSINLDFTVAYLDYWTYVEPLDTGTGSFSRNWKPFRMYGENDQLQSGTTTLSGNQSAIAYFSDQGDGVDFTEWFDGYPVGAWFHVQYWLRMNDVGSQNGMFRVQIDDVTAGQSGVTLRTQDRKLSQVRIGHYWATDGVSEYPYENSGANVYVDDVYFDTTLARVEIGNDADYTKTTHREIQIVTSWSDTAVSFVPQKGTLPVGPAFAFVIGEDDQVKASQAITLE